MNNKTHKNAVFSPQSAAFAIALLMILFFAFIIIDAIEADELTKKNSVPSGEISGFSDEELELIEEYPSDFPGQYGLFRYEDKETGTVCFIVKTKNQVDMECGAP